MKKRRLRIAAVVAVAILSAACSGGEGSADTVETTGDNAQSDTRTVIDHWEREIELPTSVDRVVVMEWEGLVAKSMHLFGVDEAIVGVDTATARQPYRTHLIPAIEGAVDIGSAWSGINYEELAALEPDVVFLESWQASEENLEMHQVEVDKIEALGIPVIVFVSPSNFEEPNIDTAWEHIEIVGQVFGVEDQATELVASLEERLDLIRERTGQLTEDEKADVVLFATIDNIMGERSIQSYFLTEIVNANNLAGPGTFITVSEEQLLGLDPDVLVVLGHDGYLDLERITSGEQVGLNWANLQELDAIADGRMVSLGYDEWRATIETPVALLKMAAAIYPELFEDIDVEAEELRLYQEVYGLDGDEAMRAIEAQRFTGELDG
jgi:iron complex transport system substrate-binding protein